MFALRNTESINELPQNIARSESTLQNNWNIVCTKDIEQQTVNSLEIALKSLESNHAQLFIEDPRLAEVTIFGEEEILKLDTDDEDDNFEAELKSLVIQ